MPVPRAGRIPLAVLTVLAAAGAPAAAHPDDACSPRLAAAAPTPRPSPLPAGVSDADMADLEQLLGGGAGASPAPAPPAPAAGPMVAVSRTFQDMNPNISIIMDVAAAAFSRAPDQRGGHDPRANGFNLQQLELAIGAPVDPFWRFDSNLVYSQFGVEIEEAYATSLQAPFDMQARVGQFLTRFGRLNGTHPHTWEFVDQPLANGKFFGGEGNRGLGGEVSWLAPVPWYMELVGSATDATGGATARSFYGNQGLGVRSPLDTQLTTSLRQFFPL
ncbi:MAG: zinc-regulated TonB-dependent outer membrane receptor, partial [Candidatus Sericytochromatia bacterium]|nr:zinc-regulated TonB-dependent outer membrane receptor [Candidatus Sericytochromatia bacterium]